MKWKRAGILLILALLYACSEQPPIKIGFIGSISGRASELSQAARDGVILAIEKTNQSGGLLGRKVELVVFDDQHDKDQAREGMNALADAGVVGIIGAITSQMAIAAAPEANKRNIVLISPTASTLELEKIKDHFFRTISTCEANARRLAKYAREELGITKVAILKDLSNNAFTDPWQTCFADQFVLEHGEVVAQRTYNSLVQNVSFLDLAEQLLAAEPEAILILSNSIDAALFSQQVDKLGKNIQMLGSDWAFTGNLVQYGGRSVEGFISTTNLNMDSADPTFQAFKKSYTTRFGVPPKFPSVLAYEATQVLFAGLSKNPNPSELDKTLASIGPVKGLQGDLLLDSYGDIKRTTHINAVRDGAFVFISKSDK